MKRDDWMCVARAAIIVIAFGLNFFTVSQLNAIAVDGTVMMSLKYFATVGAFTSHFLFGMAFFQEVVRAI